MVKPQMGRVQAMVRLCKLYPDICFTTQGKAGMNHSLGSGKVLVGHDSLCSHGRLVGCQERSILISLLWENQVNTWPVKCLPNCVSKEFPNSTNFE